MERLTKKEKKVVVLNNRNIDKNYLTIKQYEKLQELENIEEELGIDLITLFRALKEGIYYKTINRGTYHISYTCLELVYASDRFNLCVDGLLINLKNYGKTWWLEKPKEEFENE